MDGPPSLLRDVCCLVPCYNVSGSCGPIVLDAARQAECVLAIDDGSTDGTAGVLRSLDAPNLRVIRLERNSGKGTALLAGFRAALGGMYNTVVTLDGDGQHNPADLSRIVSAHQAAEADLTIGERRLTGNSRVPLRSRVGNNVATALMRARYPECPLDTQSGFRAHSRALVQALIEEVPPGRYETELRILLLALRRRMRLATVPIAAVYPRENRTTHFRPVKDSLRVLAAILGRRG
jgi:glycosyltransferase involved in cell wall biosynthesis